jgi:hypothetical protein
MNLIDLRKVSQSASREDQRDTLVGSFQQEKKQEKERKERQEAKSKGKDHSSQVSFNNQAIDRCIGSKGSKS